MPTSHCPKCWRKVKGEMGLLGHLRHCRRSEKTQIDRAAKGIAKRLPLMPPRLGGSGPHLHEDTGFIANEYHMSQMQNIEQAQNVLQAKENISRIFHLESEDGMLKILENSAQIETLCEEDQRTSKVLEEMTDLLFQLGRRVDHKVVDKLLAIVTNAYFSKEALARSFVSYKEVEVIMKKKLENQMIVTGFEKFCVRDDKAGAVGYGFRRCIIKTLQMQLLGSNHRNTLYHEQNEKAIIENTPASSHPMTARLGLEAVPAVRKSVQASEDIEVFWHNFMEDGRESFVGCVQLYSDKSKMALKKTAFEFYPLHVSLLNFRESYRRSLVLSGRTIVAYLPVGFFPSEEREAAKKRKTDGRAERMSLLHSALDLILRPLRNISLAGMECEDSNGVKRLCHTVLSMYCADIPEAKDITCVKWGTNTNHPCHRCRVNAEHLNKFAQFPIRNMLETVATVDESNRLLLDASEGLSDLNVSYTRSEKASLRARAKKLLDDISISSRIPVLHNWPLSASHHLLDVYSIFKYEPLHNMHLGISKLIKNCSIERLGKNDLFSSSLRDKRNQPKTFLSCRNYIIGEVNVLLQRIQRESPGPGLHVDFSSKSEGVRSSGLFQKYGIHSMLEAAEMKAVDQVSPFIGALLDRCCGEFDTAPSTYIYVTYAEIVQSLWRREREAAMRDTDYAHLERLISDLMPAVTALFGNIHTSSCRTLKFHLLTHVVDDLRAIGSISSADASFYESSHVKFKTQYKKSSKRHATALSETVAKLSEVQSLNTYLESKQSDAGNEEDVSISPVKLETMTGDCCTFCKNGEIVNLSMLSSLRLHARKKRKFGDLENHRAEYSVEYFSEPAKKILEDFSEQGLGVFVKLMRNKIRELYCKGLSPAEIPDKRVRLRRAQSAFVSGVPSPCGNDVRSAPDADGFYYVSIEENIIRRLQRIVCSQSFYGRRRFDNVIISKFEEEGGSNVVYFAKALGLFAVELTEEFSRYPDKRQTCDGGEYLFVRYYEVLAPGDYDAVDRSLNCVKLRWAFSHNSEDTTPWYDLIPASAIRGSVHVVRGDYGLHQTVEHKTSSLDDRDWRRQWFYVNRFRYDPSETTFYKHQFSSPEKENNRPTP